MKRTVLCVLLLAAMAVTGTALYAHTGRVTADISARLEALENHPDEDTARKISEDWEDFCSNNIFLTNNECASEISQSLVRMTSGIGTGADKADISEECRSARMLISIYRRSCAPVPANIF